MQPDGPAADVAAIALSALCAADAEAIAPDTTLKDVTLAVVTMQSGQRAGTKETSALLVAAGRTEAGGRDSLAGSARPATTDA